MVVHFFYILLAILGLSFLIFIHELGHYWMARRQGMRVEVFSIGFGKAITSWMRKGVRWQLGWLPFGGYVKIAGQERPEIEPQAGAEPADSFYAKTPLARIKVAFMGPFVNLLFAFAVFAALWQMGGREKNFSEFTHVIGWVDPKSELFAQGLRPGDQVIAYNGHPFETATDSLYAPMLSGETISILAAKVDYNSGEKRPVEYQVKTYPHPAILEKGFKTSGILASANYLIYNRLPGGRENPIPEGAPLQNSGIQYGDRIVWVDGERIFSSTQLDHLLNDHRALLTIERGGKKLLTRVPRVQVQELKLDPEFKEELIDWQFESKLNGTKLQKLFAIPYTLNNEAVVQGPVKFIEKEIQEQAFPEIPYYDLEKPLQKGDKILAIDNVPIQHPAQLLNALQSHSILIIVERGEVAKKISWKEADQQFDQEFSAKDLEKIVATIGAKQPLQTSGKLVLLKPVEPKMRSQFQLSPEKQAWITAEFLENKKKIEKVEDPELRTKLLHELESGEKRLLLGMPMVQDEKVNFNPGPLTLFKSVFEQIWQLLTGLFKGSFRAKWMGGPIGIVQLVYDNWLHGVREAIYWLGAISLNLGFLNLLPIPVLDGGTILISLFEMVTGRKLSPKTLEKIVIPFAVLLIGFFLYLTYNDLMRLFGGFLPW